MEIANDMGFQAARSICATSETVAERAAVVVGVDEREEGRISRALKDVAGILIRFKSANEALVEVPPDAVRLVLIDANVRDEVLTRDVPRLRLRFAHAAIVVMTDYPSLQMAVTAVKHGADDCVAKPLSAEEIVGYMAPLSRVATAARPLAPELPTLARVEWEYISRILARCRGNLSAAARVLGIRRSTLQRKLKKLPPTW